MSGIGSGPTPKLVERFVSETDDLFLVDSPSSPASVPAAARIVLGDTTSHLGRHERVLVHLGDALELRRAASALPASGRSKSFAVWLDEAAAALPLAPKPNWPTMLSCNSRLTPEGGAVLVARFDKLLHVTSFVEELARQVAPGGATPRPPSYVAGDLGLPVAALPPAEPSYAWASEIVPSEEDEITIPPDLLLTATPVPSRPDPVYAVTNRTAFRVTDPHLLAGPLDERILNPIGFERRPELGAATLTELGIDPRCGLTVGAVRRAAQHTSVAVDWRLGPTPEVARVVAGLAMAGIPVTGAPPADAVAWLGEQVAALLEPTGLDDNLRREEHSVVLRRAAHAHHSTYGWDRRLRAHAGLAARPEPTISVLLATRRPELLDSALGSVARQRGVNIELLLLAHGFEPDVAAVRDLVPDAVVLPHPADTRFGDVLQAGVMAASGDLVVKMDDDDWYGPDFLADLLLAKRYSGADIVGAASELVYIEPLDRTIRRSDPSEVFVKFVVAGGSTMMGRDYLRGLGGFRSVRKYVDTQLLGAAYSAGAQIYRAHGLGYVYRRTQKGHTWQVDLDHFLDGERLEQEWPGFRPSRLLEHDGTS